MPIDYAETNWAKLKDELYHEDGLWRDVVVQNTTIDDWRKWANLINRKYEVAFEDYETGLTEDRIDFSKVEVCWNDRNKATVFAAVKLGTITINCHFFDESEIEGDLDPEEVKSIRDHDSLMNYLKDISETLGKDVLLTDENWRNSFLIRLQPS
jgi:hypothetical protein